MTTQEEQQIKVWLSGQLLKDPSYEQGNATFYLILTQPDGQELVVHVTAGPGLADYLKRHQARQADTILVVGHVDAQEGESDLKAEIICCDTSLEDPNDD